MSKIQIRSTPPFLYRGMLMSRTLQPGEIEIWQSPNNLEPELYQQLPQLLSRDEVERAAAFRFERHRKQYTIGRSLLRILLAGYLQIDPVSIRFRYTPKGKPELLIQGKSKIEFNIAHSGRTILLGFTLDRKIGIDVEETRTDIEIDQISQRFFSPFERKWLAGLPLPQRYDAFFRCWTRKEAVLKATGDGLSVNLDSFDVFQNPNENSCWLETTRHQRWLVQDLDVGTGYAGAIAIEYARETGMQPLASERRTSFAQ